MTLRVWGALCQPGEADRHGPGQGGEPRLVCDPDLDTIIRAYIEDFLPG